MTAADPRHGTGAAGAPGPAELTVAAVQTSPVFGDVTGNVERALALLPLRCDLAVLPELFSTGYQFRSRAEALALAEPIPDGPTSGRLLAAAAERGVTLTAGLAERDGDRVFNAAILARPDGTWARYRKVHLFWDEKTIFDPGDLGFAVHDACGTRVGLMICFDWIFPEAARTLALAGARILLHPSNLVLPHCPSSMPVRCLENRVFAITANRVGRENRTGTPLEFIGNSRVVGPDGRVLAAGDGTGEGAAVARLAPEEAASKSVTPRNDLFADRRPELYRL